MVITVSDLVGYLAGQLFAHLTMIATVVLAGATLWYADGTRRSANAATAAVTSQTEAAARQLTASSEAAARQTLVTVVTSGRLEWMDGLREDVARFISLLGEFQAARSPAVIELRNRIEFRLDPDKKDHNQLLVKLDLMLEETAKERPQLLGEARAQTKLILENEWRRVREEAAGLRAISLPQHDGEIS